MSTTVADQNSGTVPEEQEFDFLEGEWAAVCRVPREHGPENSPWTQGPGSLTVTRILNGAVSLEFFEGPYHGQRILGVGLRAFNRTARCWEHTWTDTDSPGHFHVWRGRFEGGKIDLFGQWIDENGRPVQSRLTWSDITDRSAHWESHRSMDGGATWTPHWVIDFTRRE